MSPTTDTPLVVLSGVVSSLPGSLLVVALFGLALVGVPMWFRHR